MSDKQKGLIRAVEMHLPNSEHRFCVYHLYCNFKLQHKGLTLKDLLWRAAKATRVVDFKRVMGELKDADEQAFEWLNSKPAAEWSKAFFSTQNKTDVCLNNISESLNSLLVPPRRQCPLQMLESIRLMYMKRIAVKRSEMEQHEGVLCPRIEQLLRHNASYAMRYHADYNGNNEFQVDGNRKDTWAVNVEERTCSCRRWQLTGIPCGHAISCFYVLGVEPEDYVDKCYHKSTYLNHMGST